ncbi:NAD(P)/FAD-dependent oxidoreductase [bacterium]|nr:MAG: NAD(P)/FAD-dependent oxidoreductase [bacterium]
MSDPERWCVVGGGLLGMTLALRLAQHGRQVTVWEGAPTLGGLAAPWHLGEVIWDRHYHVTLASDTCLRNLLRELGLERELTWVTTRTGFYAGGRMLSLSSLADYAAFPLLSPLEKVRLAATILIASRIRDARALERITAVDWLRRHSGQHTLERIWYPLLRAKLGANAERVSAAFIWAIIARMYAARRSGAKRELFGYVPGGYARILERFAGHLTAHGVRAVVGQRVESVTRATGGALTVRSAAGTESFDRVVVTAASPLAARLCPELTASERLLHEGVEYQGIVCASALLERPLTPYYITNIVDAWVPFTAVIEMTALVDRAAFGGRALIYLPKYVTASDPVLARDDAAIEQEFLAALERMHPGFQRGAVQSFRISRVRYVLPLATLGYSDRLPAMRTSIPGLFIVNSAQIVNGTLNVNETVALAERAYPQLLAGASASAPRALSV